MPSTHWKEVVSADEAGRHAAAARDIAALQRRKNARFGSGRALHRKSLLVTSGELELAAELPPHARQGLFALSGRFPLWLRLSNGSVDAQSDSVPDIRGFAFRVLGLPAQPSALGGRTTHQDFSLINQVAFAFPNSEHFFGLVLAAGRGPAALLRWLFGSFGLVGGLRRIKTMKATFGKPFRGFAAETFTSVLPLAFGTHAVRWRVLPLNGQAMAAGESDWAADFERQLRHQPLRYALQAQFFEDEARTPIERADQEWLERDAPWLTLGELTLNPPPADARALQQAEAGVYDPWQGLAAHRPLGEVMRARKVVYFASQQGRGVA